MRAMEEGQHGIVRASYLVVYYYYTIYPSVMVHAAGKTVNTDQFADSGYPQTNDLLLTCETLLTVGFLSVPCVPCSVLRQLGQVVLTVESSLPRNVTWRQCHGHDQGHRSLVDITT